MSEFKPIETQEELDRIIRERLSRQKEKFSDYDAIKSRVEELEKENVDLKTTVEESGKNRSGFEQQIAELESKISGYKSERLRTRIALQYGLPIDMANRLQGEDEETLRKDAELLSGFVKSTETVPPLKSVEAINHGTVANSWAQLARTLTEGE